MESGIGTTPDVFVAFGNFINSLRSMNMKPPQLMVVDRETGMRIAMYCTQENLLCSPVVTLGRDKELISRFHDQALDQRWEQMQLMGITICWPAPPRMPEYDYYRDGGPNLRG